MKHLLVLALSAFTLLSAGCGGGGGGGGGGVQVSGAVTAQVRVVHASPDAPAVDVLVDDQVALSGVPYKGVSGYLTADAENDPNFKVNAAGTSTTVIDATPDLAAGSQYTLLAVGELAAIEPLLLLDDTPEPAAGFLKVRVLHASPTAPAVDVYVTAPSDDISASVITPFLADTKSRIHAAASMRFGGRPPLALLGRSLL